MKKYLVPTVSLIIIHLLNVDWYHSCGKGYSEKAGVAYAVNTALTEPRLFAKGVVSTSFHSSREGGKGNFDIYRSKTEEGNYAEPENLGDAINTSAAEAQPFNRS